MIIYTDRYCRVPSKSNAWQSNWFAFSIFDQKNHFHVLALVQSKLNIILLKHIKFQTATNKPQSVVSRKFLPLLRKFQKWEKSFKDKCPPFGNYPNKSTPPRQKLGCKSPRVGANFGANPQGCAGGVVMDEIDTCITSLYLFTTGTTFNIAKLSS